MCPAERAVEQPGLWRVKSLTRRSMNALLLWEQPGGLGGAEVRASQLRPERAQTTPGTSGQLLFE